MLDLIESHLFPSQLTVDQVVFPPLDRSAGCLPSLIISNNGSEHSSQNDADVMQMGCETVDSEDILEKFSTNYWILWTT
jgi:hypothetical protein